MRFSHTFFLTLSLALYCTFVVALEYQLEPQQIAPNTWLITGTTEDFSRSNGGDIVNVAFITTNAGVVVLDTGSSRRYGEALRKVIAQVSDQPVIKVFNSHHHPDHFFGNQAFDELPILALPATQRLIVARGDGYAENLYRMVGDWMRGTEVRVPDQIITPGIMEIGGHRLRLMAFSGHSGEDADLVILDETTGVLFAFDLVFYRRALTTPDTPSIEIWLEDIQQLKALEFSLLVSSHGDPTNDTRALDQTANYLSWLHQTLKESAVLGLTSTEVMNLPMPERFIGIDLVREELARSVSHLYRDYEEAALRSLTTNALEILHK
ncbi:MAG: quinoprotein relay system zinc metallohydrolase 1 [Marinospirillum sp.]|uniref:quinoprotein relay system zinc metallohydrolase 1 n=1 Tax=Marinospirillum sp. TaxID=2183934 RepID=UPI0019FF49E3|nr:quinoprotein relay system zinc metallohydrolase 1 [Marinospirillum sp.]MBE0505641.1 quinoprotein relay system zinc metallohydrolase 1 [Marinospirillum sp.]